MPPDRVAHGHGAGRLEASDLGGDELAEAGRVDHGAVAWRHHRHHLLAEALRRATDDERVDHVGVSAQHRLDLLDEHLLPAGVHHHGVAAEHHDAPVRLEPGPVAGDGDPLAVDDREGGLRPLRSSR